MADTEQTPNPNTVTADSSRPNEVGENSTSSNHEGSSSNNETINSDVQNLRHRTNVAGSSSSTTDTSSNIHPTSLNTTEVELQRTEERPPVVRQQSDDVQNIPPTESQGMNIAIRNVLKILIKVLLVVGFCILFIHMKTEYHIRQLQKQSPSPSPFQKYEVPQSSESLKKTFEKYPDPEPVSESNEESNEDTPTDSFITMLSDEDKSYAKQLKEVLASLKAAVQRLDPGTNSTQLAGVVKMKPSETKESMINFESFDESDFESSAEVENGLKEAAVSALEEIKALDKPRKRIISSSVPNPISEILEYRKKYFYRDRELEKIFFEGSRDLELIEEADERTEIRRKLIEQLIDYFFSTETDDKTRMEKVHHYRMTDVELFDRQIRLESEIFGPEDLEGNGPDTIFSVYREGYVYDNHLQTIMGQSDLRRIEKMSKQARDSFHTLLKLYLKFEKRIKQKVIEYSKLQSNSKI